jgi:hypothetical protein
MSAITDRLDLLHDHWVEFASDPRARLLRLVIEPGDQALVTAFVEKENDERLEELPDAFLEVDTPFEDPRLHGRLLRAALWEQVQAAEGVLSAEQPASTWRPPSAGDEPDDLSVALATFASFRQAHGPAHGILAIWLNPTAVRQPRTYARWLQHLAERAPAEVRFIVLDPDGSLAGLARAAPEVVRSVAPELDLGGAMREVSEAAGHLDTPGGRLRQLVLKIGAAAGDGDLPGVRALAGQAAAIATAAGLPHMVYVAHFMLGGALMGGGEDLEAAAAFEQADQVATTIDPPLGPQLRVRALLCRGTAMVKLGAFAPAATLFAGTAPLAAPDPATELDCWRLASYCHAQAGAVDQAWQAALAGLRVGRAMDPEQRRRSTLSYLCQQTQALVRRRPLHPYRASLDSEIAALFP